MMFTESSNDEAVLRDPLHKLRFLKSVIYVTAIAETVVACFVAGEVTRYKAWTDSWIFPGFFFGLFGMQFVLFIVASAVNCRMRKDRDLKDTARGNAVNSVISKATVAFLVWGWLAGWAYFDEGRLTSAERDVHNIRYKGNVVPANRNYEHYIAFQNSMVFALASWFVSQAWLLRDVLCISVAMIVFPKAKK